MFYLVKLHFNSISYKHLNANKNEINFMIDGFSSNTDKQPNNYIYIKRD